MMMNNIGMKIEQITGLCKTLKDKERSYFGKGLNRNTLLEWEEKKNIKIPEQYKEWLCFSGQCDIYGTLASFFLPREDEFGPQNCYLIGDLIGDGERLYVTGDGKKIFSLDHGEEQEYDTFEDVLNMIIEILEMEKEEI